MQLAISTYTLLAAAVLSAEEPAPRQAGPAIFNDHFTPAEAPSPSATIGSPDALPGPMSGQADRATWPQFGHSGAIMLHDAAGGGHDPVCHDGCRHGQRPTVWDKMRHHWHRIKARAQERYWGYPEEFEEPPLGMSLEANLDAQRLNGDAARMVLYDYDFVPDSDQLKWRGKQRLVKIARMLPENFLPVIIEPAPGMRYDTPAGPLYVRRNRWDLSPLDKEQLDGRLDELDQARRATVLRELTKLPFPVPEERVIVVSPQHWRIDPPIPNELWADEALRRFSEMEPRLQQGAGAAAGRRGRMGAGAVPPQGAPATGLVTPGTY